MQPKLADCFVVPKSMTVFDEYFAFQFFFYHAVVIVRIDCDCMFEEITLVQVLLLYSFNKFHLYFFLFLPSLPGHIE